MRYALVFLAVAGIAPGQSVSLASLQPQGLRTYPAGENYMPASEAVKLDTRTWPAVRFIAMSEVTYAIPPGMRSFNALVINDASRNVIPAPTGDPTGNEFRVRLMLDGAIASESEVDDATPPEQISISLGGAQTLTVSSVCEFSGGVFFLANAAFSAADATPPNPRYLPASSAGYVDASPLGRQALFKVYRPGETVPLTLTYAGTAAPAQVHLLVTPEAAWLPSSEVTLPVDLASGGGANWQVPATRGPAQLEIDAQVNGATVWQRSVRIAIAPELDVATIGDSTFNVHTSWDSWVTLFDDYASLYNGKWGRILLDWQAIEATQGTYDFSGADALVASYQAQNMRILAMLGERWPAWSGSPGASYDAAWARFVSAAAARYRGKIEAYDLFNEVDVKENEWIQQGLVDADLPLLSAGIAAVRAADPGARIVCCSTGTYDWMNYQNRLATHGILAAVDIASHHPYPTLGEAPEIPDGELNHLGDMDELAAVSGLSVWFTEENWILGPAGASGITDPALTEHDQARYVVRANLLSFARRVPYFVHSPFENEERPELHEDTLATHAQAAAFFAGATPLPLQTPAPDLYVVTAFDGGPSRGDPARHRGGEQPSAILGALWTTRVSAQVKLTGYGQIEFFDLYGNPIGPDAASLSLSGDVVYFKATAPPAVQVIAAPAEPAFTPLASPDQWQRNRTVDYQMTNGVLYVASAATAVYDHLLESAPIAVAPNACYVFQANTRVTAGAVEFEAVDAATGNGIIHAVTLQYAATGKTYPAQLWITTGNSTSIEILFSAANAYLPAQSQLEVSTPQMAPCPQ
jgi:hypothetical protein